MICLGWWKGLSTPDSTHRFIVCLFFQKVAMVCNFWKVANFCDRVNPLWGIWTQYKYIHNYRPVRTVSKVNMLLNVHRTHIRSALLTFYMVIIEFAASFTYRSIYQVCRRSGFGYLPLRKGWVWITFSAEGGGGGQYLSQTPSTGLRHPSFLGGRWRKAVLWVCTFLWGRGGEGGGAVSFSAEEKGCGERGRGKGEEGG